ncbi:hypothetical protein CFOL_v3_02487 [Cephalotus follicularis]|uniref:Protein CMSS1 n=1 Tax=Cephalotus follicularis TaxID=3775 RepID=A0A1Q3ATH8_CEPFO|nr:hypothetical protein CFOL_v3_02487 [Cephalotus follicularis]
MGNKRGSPPSKRSLKPQPLKVTKTKKKSKSKEKKENSNSQVQVPVQPSYQLSFFLDQFQSANSIQLSSLELDSIKETCIVDLSGDIGEDMETLGKHMKKAFGQSWRQVLCQGQLVEGLIDPGSPAVLIISTSALRSIELLRGVRSLTKECHSAKLFSKHMKVEEQVSLLKSRVNIASGTPSRIKKLIDIEALGLSRLAVIVLDIHRDVKGYSLLTLPQVRDEFWDLYKNCFHRRIMQGDLRICLYGPIPNGKEFEGGKKGAPDN